MNQSQKDIIENFISTIDLNLPEIIHIKNAMRDSYSYKWTSPMLIEILDKIDSKYTEQEGLNVW